MLRGPVPALSEDSKDANTPCPLFRHSQQLQGQQGRGQMLFPQGTVLWQIEASGNSLAPGAGQGCSRRLMLAGIIPPLPL